MRVLLIEDDTSTAKLIELMLRSEGYVCDSTDLGEDGLDIGKLYDYDLIVLDPISTGSRSCGACARPRYKRRS